MAFILNLQGMEAPEGHDDGGAESTLSLIGCTPHENSSLSILCKGL